VRDRAVPGQVEGVAGGGAVEGRDPDQVFAPGLGDPRDHLRARGR